MCIYILRIRHEEDKRRQAVERHCCPCHSELRAEVVARLAGALVSLTAISICTVPTGMIAPVDVVISC